MKTTKNDTINNLINEIQKLKPAPDGYSYQFEFAAVYGGYRLVLVNNCTGGHSGCFGGNGCEARVNYKQFINKLNTIISCYQ